MSGIRTIVEATWQDDEGDDQKDNYILLHFGIKYDLVDNGSGGIIPVQYTVAICQNVRSGVIETFFPEQLRVLGVSLKELETKNNKGNDTRSRKN